MVDVLMAFGHTFQSAAGATGDGVAMAVGGLGSLGIQVEGITTATITFEGTIDGVTWYVFQVTKLDDGNKVTTAAADGLFRANVAGLDQFRCRISAFTSGSITVVGKGMP